MKPFAIVHLCLLAACFSLAVTAHAQKISYFPLEQGNSWTYRVVPHGLPPSHSYDTVMRVGSDTLMPNGKRYLMTSWGALRIDSTSGIVWKYDPYPARPLTDSTKHCTDTTETEFVNLSIDSSASYTLCPGPPAWQVSFPDTVTRIGQLPLRRKAIHWDQWLEKRSFADSIGLYFIEYNMFVYTTWELIRANVYGTLYTPVELEYLRASAGTNHVTLHWRTAEENDNMGFEVQRQHADIKADAWEALGFVNAHGARREYTYVDVLTPSVQGSGAFEYRLKQVDYSGSHWYSPRVRVTAVSSSPLPRMLELFPIPVSDHVVIRWNDHMAASISYTLYTRAGDCILAGTKETSSMPGTDCILDLPGIPPGVYFLLVRNGETVYMTSFPVMRRF